LGAAQKVRHFDRNRLKATNYMYVFMYVCIQLCINRSSLRMKTTQHIPKLIFLLIFREFSPFSNISEPPLRPLVARLHSFFPGLAFLFCYQAERESHTWVNERGGAIRQSRQGLVKKWQFPCNQLIIL
jgi:hypothetical protein